ncbi:MAG TPA: RNA-binding protein [Candidatus Woesebacteria bacterium]|nr:RNA-binding protein [Candidatus Woesebacteria bacterium]
MDQKRSPNKRLFIGSLPYRFTEGELLSLFVPFGKVISLKIMHNRWGKSRGMGFIEFDTLESAIAAKEKMHQYKLGDLSIIVDFAQPDPFLTPEGKARHEEALERHPQRRQSENFTSRPAPNKKPEVKHFSSPKQFEHQRQSVFDSRFHHARVGAKFATRNKKK